MVRHAVFRLLTDDRAIAGDGLVETAIEMIARGLVQSGLHRIRRRQISQCVVRQFVRGGDQRCVEIQ